MKNVIFENSLFFLTIIKHFRYVNDSPRKFANAVMKKYENEKGSFLALFALKEIPEGSELR